MYGVSFRPLPMFGPSERMGKTAASPRPARAPAASLARKPRRAMPSAALLEVGDEGVDVGLVGRDLAPRLLEGPLGHEALGPDDDPGPDAAEDDEQQQALRAGSDRPASTR